MSLLTKSIGLAKKAKHRFQDQLRARTPVYLSPVRRIEQVALNERIVFCFKTAVFDYIVLAGCIVGVAVMLYGQFKAAAHASAAC